METEASAASEDAAIDARAYDIGIAAFSFDVTSNVPACATGGYCRSGENRFRRQISGNRRDCPPGIGYERDAASTWSGT